MDYFNIFTYLLFALINWTYQAAIPPGYANKPVRTPDEKFMTVTVCRGGRRTIACPALELLHVFTAFYGKMSGHDCEDPVSSPRFQIPTCSSKNAAQIIREECHGQQSCDIYAEDSMYDNPCPEVLKYLFVSYTCQGKSDVLGKLRSMEAKQTIPVYTPKMTSIGKLMEPIINAPAAAPEARTVSVCSGRTGNIVCPDLRIIRIHAAFFGKQSGRDCLGRLTRDSLPTCFAPYAISTVRDTCQGQQSCDLFSEQRLYGRNTCPSKEPKYLSVTYSCVGHSNIQRQLQNLNQRGTPGAIALQICTIVVHAAYPYPYYGAWPAANAVPAPAPAYTSNYNQFARQQPMPLYQQTAARRTPYPAVQGPSYNNRYPQMNLRPNPSLYQKPATRQMQPYQYQPAQFNPQMNQQLNPYSAFTASPSCDLCNGDCNDWSCYGCGGCETPQMVQQTYMYPYQRQDAAFHDSFLGNEMALSGMVIWPVPKLPKALRKLNPPKARSQTYEEEADDLSGSGEGSGDVEDDEDDSR